MVRAMFGVTLRQRAAAAVVLLIGAVAVASSALGQWRLAGAAAVALLTAATVTMLDLRRRQGELARRVRATAKRIDKLYDQHLREVGAGSTNIRLTAEVITGRRELESALDAMRAELLRPLQERVAAIDAELHKHLGGRSGFRKDLAGLIQDQTREVEALFQLFGRIEPGEPMPPSGRWALAPQGLLNLCALVARHRPTLAVELGSGTSTIWLGYALAEVGADRLISLDHEEEFAGQTRAAVRLHREWTVSTDVRQAPLTTVEIGDERYEWYDPALIADLDGIDLLIVDGPPGRTGRHARYPALPLLVDRLADGALVVLDDIDRADEREIVDRWLDQFPQLTREPTILGVQAVLRFATGPAARAAGHAPAED
jgi:predicted O-methyltransferase YrrM